MSTDLTDIHASFDDNQAVWTDGAVELPPCPPLTGAQKADVVIIGGGFTGMSTAYHLSRRFPERKVVLVEARRVANGASGRNGGQLLNWVNGVDTTDAELTRRVFDATLHGIEGVLGIIARHGLNVRHARDGALEVFTQAAEAEHAHEKVERLQRWGLPQRFLRDAALSDTLRMNGAVGAILDPTAGQLNGVDYLRALRPVVEAQGVTIYEDSPVTAVELGRPHRVRCLQGSVEAPTLVLATGGYTARLGFFRSGVFPLHSHCLATAPLLPEEREELGWRSARSFCDDMDRISYGCLTTDGRIVFGGGSNAAYDYAYGGPTAWRFSTKAAMDAIEARLHQYFPRLRAVGITHRWTGTLGITLSRVCSMGTLPGHDSVLYAVGFSGHGVTLANLAGEVLTDLYSGDNGRWRGQPFLQKRLGGIPPDPLRWIGYHLYTRLTGRSPRRST